ncbi:MAG: GNAT family N-acetyltransferase [Pseudomonadota bacterium]
MKNDPDLQKEARLDAPHPNQFEVRPVASDPGTCGTALDLIRSAFAYMDGRVDPPSSIHRLTRADVQEKAASGDLLGVYRDENLIGCVTLSWRERELYIGKLAVQATWRGNGLARRLVEAAETRAREAGLRRLVLESRIELTENHTAFARMGFVRTGASAHAGYDRPTSITMTKDIAP